MNTRKIFLDSTNINCRPNSILSSRIYNYLLKNGHVIVDELSDAEFVILNTCGADKRFDGLSKTLLEQYGKRIQDGSRLIALGCLGTLDANLPCQFPNVSFVADINDLDEIFLKETPFIESEGAYLDPVVIDKLSMNKTRGLRVANRFHLLLGKGIYTLFKGTGRGIWLEKVLEEVTGTNKVFVEIGKGCTSNCSYCVIKKVKGDILSRDVTSILKDIEVVADQSKNLCLVADDCGSYGFDIGENIFNLLNIIASNYPDLGIDLCYVNPLWLERNAQKYVDLFRRVKINSVNIPMQSGSDRIVKLMNRKYSVQNVLKVVGTLRGVSPQTLYWTHLITGFPGEKEEDFRKTVSILPHFDLSYKFIYSEKDGVPSASLPDKVPENLKLLRIVRLGCKGYTVFGKRFGSELLSLILHGKVPQNC